jgi:excisionase family DNA binding protein
MEKTNSSDQLAYSIRDTARKIGVSAQTIRQAIKNGQLQAKRLGRRVVVPTWAIEAFLQGR